MSAQFAFDSIGLDETLIKSMPAPDLAKAMLRLVVDAGAGGGTIHVTSFSISKTDGRVRASIELEVREAWAWLGRELHIVPWDGEHYRLSRRGRQVAEEIARGGALLSRAITEDMVRPELGAALTNYYSGHYDAAVFEAMRTVEICVRQASGLLDSDIGVTLMRKAFAVSVGPLTNKGAPTAEQQGMSDLFAGSIGAFRNGAAHRTAGTTMSQAWDVLMLAAHLLRILG